MGWLSMRSLGGHATPRAYLDDQFTYQRDTHRLTVLRSALVGLRVYYAACERTDADGTRIVFAVVCLVAYNPRAQDGYIFGYKDMDETVGPYECECPAPILDLLTETDYPHALDWRARCRANIAKRKAIAAKPALRAGQTICFDTPIRFRDGRELSRLDVVSHPRTPRTVLLRDPETGSLYRIPGIKKRAYRLINRAVQPGSAS